MFLSHSSSGKVNSTGFNNSDSKLWIVKWPPLILIFSLSFVNSSWNQNLELYRFLLTGQEVNRERCTACSRRGAQQRKHRGFWWRLSLGLSGGGEGYYHFPGMVGQIGVYYQRKWPDTNRDTQIRRGWDTVTVSGKLRTLRSISFLCCVQRFLCPKLPLLKSIYPWRSLHIRFNLVSFRFQLSEGQWLAEDQVGS